MGQRLDRNSGNGRGKYGLIKNRRLRDCLLKANDGESGVEFAASVCKAIVVLERAGIIVRNGVTIVMQDCPEEQPDRITCGDKTYRVANWTFDFEYYLGSASYGVVVATCDDMTIQNAVAESGGSGL